MLGRIHFETRGSVYSRIEEASFSLVWIGRGVIFQSIVGGLECLSMNLDVVSDVRSDALFRTFYCRHRFAVLLCGALF